MTAEMPSKEELKRSLSWVEFLEPLSEEEFDVLVEHASFVQLEAGEELVLSPEEQVAGSGALSDSSLFLLFGCFQLVS